MPNAKFYIERDVRASKAYLPGRRTGRPSSLFDNTGLMCVYACVMPSTCTMILCVCRQTMQRAYANFSHSTHKYKQRTTESFNQRTRLLLLKKLLLLWLFLVAVYYSQRKSVRAREREKEREREREAGDSRCAMCTYEGSVQCSTEPSGMEWSEVFCTNHTDHN